MNKTTHSLFINNNSLENKVNQLIKGKRKKGNFLSRSFNKREVKATGSFYFLLTYDFFNIFDESIDKLHMLPFYKFIQLLILAVCLIFPDFLFSQNLENYTLLKAEGKIPEDFRMLSVDKFQADKQNIDKSDKRRIKKTKEEFLLETNFLIDELLLSGKVLFNDPVTAYVNKVADVLLKDQPELRSKIRIYTVKTSAVNAFTTNGGLIFINLGLIAQLEDEAQLAFILAHEIVHFSNNHVIDRYVEFEKIKKGKDAYRRSSLDDKLLARSNFSKEHEFEADLEGLELYLKSDYSLNSISGVFDVLQYSYLPFDDIVFDKSFFESEELIFPDDYFLDEVAGISAEDDYDDSKSTHPNTRRRKSTIQRRVDNKSDEGKVPFIVSSDDFFALRETCRFELSHLYLLNRDYGNAVYNSYMLLKKHPNHKYLEKSIAKALYSLSKYKNNGNVYAVLSNYKNIEGSSQQLFHFLKSLSKEELNTVALRYCWKLRKKYPEDQYIKDLTEDLFRELTCENEILPSYFHTKPREILKEEHNIEEKKENMEELSKYEKIKIKKDIQTIEGNENFIKYAFVDLFKDDEFIDRFDHYSLEFDKKKEEEERVWSKAEKKAKYKKERQQKRRIRRKGYALGLDKLVVVDPYYKKLDQRKQKDVKYVKSESSQLDYMQKIKSNADLAGLNVNTIGTKEYGEMDVDQFNAYALLNDWINERFAHEGMNIIMTEQEHIQQVKKLFHTRHFAWTGVVSARERKYEATYYLCLSALGVYTLPLGIIYALTPKYSTFFYFIVFDIENSEPLMLSKHFFGKNDQNDIINSFVYDCMMQVKNTRSQ